MTTTLVTNSDELTTVDPEHRVLHDAALGIDDDTIAWIGPANRAPAADKQIDAQDRAMLPGWVDSHTHLVFAGDRSAEFEARMAGEPYAAGGINHTTEATRAASDRELTMLLRQRIDEAIRGGTTYLETKTRYGLDVDEEIRHARLAAAEVDTMTFLGGHLVPDETNAEAYLADVTGPMLEGVTPYVQGVDVFCETGAFDEEQSCRVLQAGADAGLGLRVHGN